MAQGRRTYHGRRGPSPIVWLIALVVLIAAVVLVIVGLTKRDKAPVDSDPTQTAEPNTPDNTQKPDDTQTDDNPVSTDPGRLTMVPPTFWASRSE